MRTSTSAIFKYQNVAKASLSHYTDCLVKELYIDHLLVNPTYTRMPLTKEKVMDNRGSVLCSYGILNKELILIHSAGYLNCIKVFHKQHYITAPPTCYKKHLSKLLRFIKSLVNPRFQMQVKRIICVYKNRMTNVGADRL